MEILAAGRGDCDKCHTKLLTEYTAKTFRAVVNCEADEKEREGFQW